jgi:hypothetical protein
MPEQTVASDDGIRQLTLVNPNDEKLRHLIREQLFDGLGGPPWPWPTRVPGAAEGPGRSTMRERPR